MNWNAEITREETRVYLGWQSLKRSMIDNVGKVEFKETLNGIGTVLHKEIDYFPHTGSIGKGIPYLFNGLFERMIREDIQRFKTYAEDRFQTIYRTEILNLRKLLTYNRKKKAAEFCLLS